MQYTYSRSPVVLNLQAIDESLDLASCVVKSFAVADLHANLSHALPLDRLLARC